MVGEGWGGGRCCILEGGDQRKWGKVSWWEGKVKRCCKMWGEEARWRGICILYRHIHVCVRGREGWGARGEG